MQLHVAIFKPNGKYYTGGLVEVPNKRPEVPQLYHDPNFEAIARAQQLLQDESFRSRRWLIVATVPSEYDADPECGWWPMCWPPADSPTDPWR